MWRDDAYLLDILLAARKVRQYLGRASREEFERNEILHDAIMRNLEIIGEAASRLSEEMRNQHPEVPWTEIISMRNRLIHDYPRVKLETVWETARKDIPALIALLEPMIPPEEE